MKRRVGGKSIIRIIIGMAFLFILSVGIMYHKYRIDSIYIAHMEMGKIYVQYKIDLVNNMYWEDTENYSVGNRNAQDEGFIWGMELGKADIIGFRFASLLHGINFWKKQYLFEGVKDGHQWEMIINYSDGREKHIYGSNRYPSTYDELKQDFINLTGKDILNKLEIQLPWQIWR